tara:strand:- start:436 stop:1110 length:675 start_codon:yes stop_codon:yes gene_type:complete
MPERILPGLGLRAFYDPGQRDWGTSVSEDLRTLSVLVQARALSRSTPLPATGTAGDVYIVPPDAPINANALALWDGAPGSEAWVFFTPQPGWAVWIEDEVRAVRFDGVGWVAAPRPGVVPIRVLPGPGHVLELVDTGCVLETSGASPVTITIPADAGVPFETGTLISITQGGSGSATVVAAAGVSLNGVSAGSGTLDGPWSGVALTKHGPDAWVLQGALAGAVA